MQAAVAIARHEALTLRIPIPEGIPIPEDTPRIKARPCESGGGPGGGPGDELLCGERGLDDDLFGEDGAEGEVQVEGAKDAGGAASIHPWLRKGKAAAEEKEAPLVTEAEGFKLRLSENSKTGYHGVTKLGDKYVATGLPAGSSSRDGRQVHLGTFDTAVQAAVMVARHLADPEAAVRAAAAAKKAARMAARMAGAKKPSTAETVTETVAETVAETVTETVSPKQSSYAQHPSTTKPPQCTAPRHTVETPPPTPTPASPLRLELAVLEGGQVRAALRNGSEQLGGGKRPRSAHDEASAAMPPPQQPLPPRYRSYSVEAGHFSFSKLPAPMVYRPLPPPPPKNEPDPAAVAAVQATLALARRDAMNRALAAEAEANARAHSTQREPAAEMLVHMVSGRGLARETAGTFSDIGSTEHKSTAVQPPLQYRPLAPLLARFMSPPPEQR